MGYIHTHPDPSSPLIALVCPQPAGLPLPPPPKDVNGFCSSPATLLCLARPEREPLLGPGEQGVDVPWFGMSLSHSSHKQPPVPMGALVPEPGSVTAAGPWEASCRNPICLTAPAPQACT